MLRFKMPFLHKFETRLVLQVSSFVCIRKFDSIFVKLSRFTWPINM